MTKGQHEMIMEAIAQKRKIGYADLSTEQKSQMEDIAGQKFEDMWIGSESQSSAIID
jgi:hypothetical protein